MSKAVRSISRIALILGMIAVASLFLSCRTEETKKWIVIGPFANEQAADGSCSGFYVDALAPLGGEAALSVPGAAWPEVPASDRAGGSAPSITALSGASVIKVADAGGVVDFRAAFPGAVWRTAYAGLEFDSPGGEYSLRFGSDDGCRVWVNGELVIDQHVHRALGSDDEAVPVTLRSGANRILAKVCQGDGAWSLSCRFLSAAEEDAYMDKDDRFKLAIAVPDIVSAADRELVFSIGMDPARAVRIPIWYRLRAADDTILLEEKAETGRPLRVSLPDEAIGRLRLEVETTSEFTGGIAWVLSGDIVDATFFRGDADAFFAAAVRRARAAALDEKTLAAGADIAPTLEFLADRMEGKLEASLVSPRLKIQALGFAEDLMAALEAGTVNELRGYRQWAYRSEIDGSVQPYSLYLPSDYPYSMGAYGLIVALHGYSGNDFSGGQFLADLAPRDFVIVSAYGRGDMHYRSVGEQDVLDVMDRVIERYGLNPGSVYLTGNSMGGLGTWRLGSLYPDRFAAIAPIAGWTGTEWLENLRNIDTLIIHGDADPTVPVGMDRAAFKTLSQVGYRVRFDELAGAGHSAWTAWIKTHQAKEFLDYFYSRFRETSPERITATIPYARYGRQYWITIDELDTSGELAAPSGVPKTAMDEAALFPKPGRIDAVRKALTHFIIKTERLRAFTIDLAKAGAVPMDNMIQIDVDSDSVGVGPGRTRISLAKDAAGHWQEDYTAAGAAAESAAAKPRHDGGGLADLFTRPLLIVYGTADPARAPALERAARRLADWSWTAQIPIGVKIGQFRVASDTAVGEAELAAYDILAIGRPSENLLSRRAEPELAEYYKGDVIQVDGKTYPGRGLSLLLPSPLAPGKLFGYMDLPADFLPDDAAVNEWCRYFPFRFRNTSVTAAATYPGFGPDIAVLKGHPLRDEVSIWFDRNWERVR